MLDEADRNVQQMDDVAKGRAPNYNDHVFPEFSSKIYYVASGSDEREGAKRKRG